MKFTLPAHWASYLINNDATGLSRQEVDEVDAWLEANNLSLNSFVDCGESFFSWKNDANNLGGEVAEFTTLWFYNFFTNKSLAFPPRRITFQLWSQPSQPTTKRLARLWSRFPTISPLAKLSPVKTGKKSFNLGVSPTVKTKKAISPLTPWRERKRRSTAMWQFGAVKAESMKWTFICFSWVVIMGEKARSKIRAFSFVFALIRFIYTNLFREKSVDKFSGIK